MTNATPENGPGTTDTTPTDTASDGAATFAASTDHTVTGADVPAPTPAPADPAPAPAADPAPAPAVDAVSTASVVDVPKNAVSTDIADVETLVRDIHKMVSDIHEQFSHLAPIVAQVGPMVETVSAEVKDKGIGGLLPHLIAAFRG